MIELTTERLTEWLHKLAPEHNVSRRGLVQHPFARCLIWQGAKSPIAIEGGFYRFRDPVSGEEIIMPLEYGSPIWEVVYEFDRLTGPVTVAQTREIIRRAEKAAAKREPERGDGG